MKPADRLRIQQSETRERINALLAEDATDESRAEMRELTTRAQNIEVELRAAIVAEPDAEVRTVPMDSEHRERLQLRQAASLTNYLTAALQGRMPSGAELQLRQAAGVSDTGIPVELFDLEVRADAPSVPAVTGRGVNVDPVRPMIYSRAVLPRIGVAMPRVESGGYSTMTISTGLTAAATAAGAARESTAAVLTPQTTTPHRVSARLSLRIEDIATVGVANYESALRQNLMLTMSDELDKLGLNGDGLNANPSGLLKQLTDPGSNPSDVVTFDAFVEAMAGGIDGGPWAETMQDVTLLVNAETMRLAESTFQSATNYKGELSSAAYLRQHGMGFFSSSRMPATVSDIAAAIRYRSGTMGMDGVDAMRVAVCPMWNELTIDDIYTDSASGIRHITMHNLIGDVLIEQPSAYEQIALKVS